MIIFMVYGISKEIMSIYSERGKATKGREDKEGSMYNMKKP
jgi:hypothetical protein